MLLVEKEGVYFGAGFIILFGLTLYKTSALRFLKRNTDFINLIHSAAFSFDKLRSLRRRILSDAEVEFRLLGIRRPQYHPAVYPKPLGRGNQRVD